MYIYVLTIWLNKYQGVYVTFKYVAKGQIFSMCDLEGQ